MASQSKNANQNTKRKGAALQSKLSIQQLHSRQARNTASGTVQENRRCNGSGSDGSRNLQRPIQGEGLRRRARKLAPRYKPSRIASVVDEQRRTKLRVILE